MQFATESGVLLVSATVPFTNVTVFYYHILIYFNKPHTILSENSFCVTVMAEVI
jgi:hypothetical protein